MSPRRLLVVTDEMEVGGSQRQITYLLGGLDRERWNASLLYFRNQSFLVDQLADLRIDVLHVPKQRRVDPRFVLRYLQALRAGRYDVVHAFSLTAELWTALASVFMRRPPRLVASVRGMYLLQPRWFWWLKRFVLGRSSAVIANARACAEAAAMASRLPLDRFEVIPNGIAAPERLDHDARSALRARLGVPAGRAFGLFVGRMVHQKNPACLVRALAGMARDERPWIALAGDGPLRAETEAAAARESLSESLCFLGERSDTGALMQAADFLVLPSLHEGMPNVLLEAMAAGCPIVASDVGGSPELVEHEVGGLLFPNDDDIALGECLGRMSRDTDLRARLAAHASALAMSRYTIERMVAATEAVYLRCLASTHTATALPLRPNTRTGDRT